MKGVDSMDRIESIRGDESKCTWCGEAMEPDWQGAVVIDEDERCYAERPEAYYDPTRRVIPRSYGHTACFLESRRHFQVGRRVEEQAELEAEGE
jgi:RNA polymerase subunit RPABC4/transcription elongation factor Spt4